MKQLQNVKSGPFTTSLNPWKAMPKASKTPEGYILKVDGKEIKAPDIAITGGGTFPVYTYLKQGDEVKWFAGSFESGTAVEITTPVAATTPVTPEPTPAPTEASKKNSKKK